MQLEASEARAEEESENASIAQQQSAKASAELAAFKSKRDREVAELQNEVDEAKWVPRSSSIAFRSIAQLCSLVTKSVT